MAVWDSVGLYLGVGFAGGVLGVRYIWPVARALRQGHREIEEQHERLRNVLLQRADAEQGLRQSQEDLFREELTSISRELEEAALGVAQRDRKIREAFHTLEFMKSVALVARKIGQKTYLGGRSRQREPLVNAMVALSAGIATERATEVFEAGITGDQLENRLTTDGERALHAFAKAIAPLRRGQAKLAQALHLSTVIVLVASKNPELSADQLLDRAFIVAAESSLDRLDPTEPADPEPGLGLAPSAGSEPEDTA